MNRSTSKENTIAILAGFVGAILFGWIIGVTMANGQTPPVSILSALPDTSTTEPIEITFSVESDVPWDKAGGVGLYYRIPDSTGWLYMPTVSGATSPVNWHPPLDNAQYEFFSTVTDNEGNNEGYGFYPKASTYFCSTCDPVDCPPITTIQAVVALAEAGFNVGADTPNIRWYWTHPTTGTQVVVYEGQWDVGGVITSIPTIPFGTPEYGEILLPYAYGETQTLRVRGVDAANRAGPWSLWGNPFTDDGPPGQPGEPARTLQMVD